MASTASLYLRRRVAVQLLLGYGSGLPYLLSGETLGTWMASEGINLKTIGVFSMVGLAYTFKFAWAPLLDRYPVPVLGRRRGWMLLFQLLLGAAIIALGTADPVHGPLRAALLALQVAVLAASQDIVVDAYRTDVLREEERGAGVALFTFGYRMGMLAAGAGALILADKVGWAHDYRILGATMGIGVLGTLLAPEPERHVARPRSVVDAYVRPFQDLFSRPSAGLILSFVLLYRLGYLLATPMNAPFLIKIGFAKASIAYYRKGVGLLATLFGGLLAGPAEARLGLRRSLLVFGLLTALVHLSWVALAYTGPKPYMLAITIGVENVCIGLSVTAFEAYLMALCNSSYSATQFAVLAATQSAAGRLLGGLSGFCAAALGWPLFFGATTLLVLPSLFMVSRLPRTEPSDEAERPATAR